MTVAGLTIAKQFLQESSKWHVKIESVKLQREETTANAHACRIDRFIFLGRHLLGGNPLGRNLLARISWAEIS